MERVDIADLASLLHHQPGVILSAVGERTDEEARLVGKRACVETEIDNLGRRVRYAGAPLLHQEEQLGWLRQIAGEKTAVILKEQMRRPQMKWTGESRLRNWNLYDGRVTTRKTALRNEEEPKDALVTDAHGEGAIFTNKSRFPLALNAFLTHAALRVCFQIIHDCILTIHNSTNGIEGITCGYGCHFQEHRMLITLYK